MASELSSSLATSHEVDAVSSLDESLGDEENSSSVAEGAPNAVVSLLSRLKSLPRLSDFVRKRKGTTNPPTGFTKFTQLHVVTSQFVMFISCALRVWIEDGTGSRPDSCEVLR